MLMNGLLTGGVDVAGVAHAYRAAMGKAATQGQTQSVLEHIEFIIRMLQGDEEREPLVAQLKALADAMGA
jgi:hypothetical protein